MAHALPRAGLGAGEGARHPLQHRRRPAHRPQPRRPRLRPVVGLPRNAPDRYANAGAYGRDSRSGTRTNRLSYPFPRSTSTATASASSTRARTLPPLHLREVRPRGPRAARAVRVAGLRREGAPPAAARVRHPARDQGAGPDARGAGRQARRRERRGLPAYGARLQQGRARRRALRSVHAGQLHGAVSLEPAKSNWANAIDQPPFEAYATTCGITFTFGGLRVDADAQVLDHDAAKIGGLYAAGGMRERDLLFKLPERRRPRLGRRTRPPRRRVGGARPGRQVEQPSDGAAKGASCRSRPKVLWQGWFYFSILLVTGTPDHREDAP